MSYTREAFLNKLRVAVTAIGIKEETVVISHGGASLLFDMRDTTDDIDVAIPEGVFGYMQMSNLGKYQILPAAYGYPEVRIIVFMGVDFHIDSGDKETFLHESGFRVTTKHQLLKDRLALNRPKDQPDIAKLREELTV